MQILCETERKPRNFFNFTMSKVRIFIFTSMTCSSLRSLRRSQWAFTNLLGQCTCQTWAPLWQEHGLLLYALVPIRQLSQWLRCACVSSRICLDWSLGREAFVIETLLLSFHGTLPFAVRACFTTGDSTISQYCS